MNCLKIFHGNSIFLVGLFSVLNNGFVSAQHQHNNIEVYVSSQTGDRLTKKKNTSFISETRLSLPVITVNERKFFQTIEGFGATFNEAGMICLNSLSLKDQNRVFKSLFDSVKGAGFTVMKSPIAACDRPGLASTSSSTEYCAGRTSIGASVRMKSLKTETCRRRRK